MVRVRPESFAETGTENCVTIDKKSLLVTDNRRVTKREYDSLIDENGSQDDVFTFFENAATDFIEG